MSYIKLGCILMWICVPVCKYIKIKEKRPNISYIFSNNTHLSSYYTELKKKI